MNLTQSRVHQLFPAAGVGQRFGQSHPKQYTRLAGKTLLEWTLDAWRDLPFEGERLLVLSPGDELGQELATAYPGLRCVIGGSERAQSVLAGLAAMSANADDWVMVHDIARPCVRRDDIIELLTHCRTTGHGALLARPLTDTIKRSHSGHVSTVERTELWAAMTPQCFQYGPLRQAIAGGLAQAVNLTDEASAIEWLGQPVDLVSGSIDNVKLTNPDDLGLVAYYLTQQGRLSAS